MPSYTFKDFNKCSNDQELFLIISGISKPNNVRQLIMTSLACGFIPIMTSAPKLKDKLSLPYLPVLDLIPEFPVPYHEVRVEGGGYEEPIFTENKEDKKEEDKKEEENNDEEKQKIKKRKILPLTQKIIWFENLKQAKEFLNSRQVKLYGIEISSTAININNFSVKNEGNRIALMPGNEGEGLHTNQINLCDGLIYIPQYGDTTASLNVHVASTIIMYKILEKIHENN